MSLQNIVKEKYNAEIILGGNWKGYPGNHKPITRRKGNCLGEKEKDESNYLPISNRSRINCLAAIDWYEKGLIEKIIVGTGQSAGKDWPSEAEAMKDYILRHSKIYEEDILTHEDTLETYSEIERNLEIVKENHFGNIVLLTVNTQLLRCKRHLKKLEENVDCYSSQDIVSEKEDCIESRQRGKNPYPLLVENFANSPGVKYYEKTKEFGLRIFQLFGITKSLTKLLAKSRE